jgi:hypothetical protein
MYFYTLFQSMSLYYYFSSYIQHLIYRRQTYHTSERFVSVDSGTFTSPFDRIGWPNVTELSLGQTFGIFPRRKANRGVKCFAYVSSLATLSLIVYASFDIGRRFSNVYLSCIWSINFAFFAQTAMPNARCVSLVRGKSGEVAIFARLRVLCSFWR